jgi:hypothetical protein
MDTPQPLVAICNASDDTLDVLAGFLTRENVPVVRGHVRDFRRGTSDLSTFLLQHNPAVVVWDVSCPYYQNWVYLQKVRAMPEFAGRTTIVTAPNVARLNDAVGEPVAGALELVGNPEDLDLLLQRVLQHVSQTAPAGGSVPSPRR